MPASVLAALILALVHAAAWAAPRALLRSGDAVADGERLASFGRPVAARSGAVAFVGTTGALMIAEAGGLTVVARTGDPLPAPLEGTFNTFGASAINDAGVVAFRAALNATQADDGIFLYRDGALAPVVLGGGSLGDSAGVGDPLINDGSDVAYQNASGIWLWSAANGSATRLVASGSAAPGGGTFRRMARRPALNDSGVIAFFAEVRDGRDGVFAVSAADGLRLVSSVNTNRRRVAVAINASGRVAFTHGTARRGTADTLSVFDPGTSTLSTLARSGTQLGAERLLGIAPTALGLDDAGRVTFEGYFARPGPDVFRPVVVAPGAVIALTQSTGRRAGTFSVSIARSGRVAWIERGEVFRYDDAPTRVVGRSDATPIGAAVVAGAPAVNDAGSIVFRAERESLYVAGSDGAVRAALRAGDAVDGLGTVTAFGAHTLDGERVACLTSLADGRHVLLAGEVGALRPVVVSGAPAPEGGTLGLDAVALGLDGPRLVFGATVTDERGVGNGLFRADLRRGRVRRLGLRGGRLVHVADVVAVSPKPPRLVLEGESRRAYQVVVVADGAAAARVAAEGRRAPGTAGRFSDIGVLATAARRVLFAASVSDGRTSGGLFLWREGRVKPVTVVGDVLPGGGTVAAPPSALALSRDGRHAAFVLPVLEGDGEREALVVTTDGVARVIARAGDPTAAGGTLAAFGEVASVSIADTTIVYAGTLNGAGAAFGLFVCPNLSCD